MLMTAVGAIVVLVMMLCRGGRSAGVQRGSGVPAAVGGGCGARTGGAGRARTTGPYRGLYVYALVLRAVVLWCV